MPSTLVKGQTFENTVRRRLRKLGYIVFKCQGSRPVDLVAFRDGVILLVECKTGLNPHLPERQAKQLLDLSQRINATLILAVRKKYRGIRWFIVTDKGLEETKARFNSILS
jgi:Holliday junction resolvase